MRDFLARVLGWLPSGLFEPLRRVYFASPPGSPAHRLAGALLRVVRYRAIGRRIDHFEVLPAGGLWLKRCSSLIARNLYWLGSRGFEPSEVDWWIHYCRRASHVVEIGGNIGYYTVAGGKAAPQARYVAVEPHPASAALLRENLRINGVSHVEVLEAAVVGDDRPTVQLMVPALDGDEAPALAHVQGSGAADLRPGRSLTVAAVSSRALAGGADLLKLDIEGLELSVLAPIADLLAERRPVIFIELLDGEDQLAAFLDELAAAAGYGRWVIAGDRLVALDRLSGRRLQHELGARDVILADAAHRPEAPSGVAKEAGRR